MKIKDIALSAAYVGQRVVKAICVGAQEVWSAVKYIVFKDPAVEQICVANFSSDGIGVLPEDAAKVTDIGTIFRGNTEITSFDELENFPITRVQDNAFLNCSGLSTLKIPNTVTVIGDSAFYNCTSLRDIGTDLSHVVSFGLENAFRNTPKMVVDLDFKRLTGSNWVAFRESGVRSVKFHILSNLVGSEFRDCKNLAYVRLGVVRTIGDNVFNGCTSLNDIDINNNTYVSSIGVSAFDGCTSIHIEELNLPNVTTIGDNAFRGVGIRKISNIGTCGVQGTYGGDAFSSLTELEEVILPDRAYWSAMFQKCTKLRYIEIPYTIREVTWFLAGCTNYTEPIELPNLEKMNSIAANSGVKKIKNLGKITTIKATTYIFLEELVVPLYVTEIQKSLNATQGLTNLVLHPIAPPSLGELCFTGGLVNVYVPNESINNYKEASVWIKWANANKIKPITDYITFTDITSSLASDVVYNTALEIYAQFDDATIAEVGAKSMIYNLDGSYDTLKITGNGGATSRLYCFIDENNEVITTADKSLSAAPLYICIPSMARKMVICCDATSTNVKVEIGKHVE